MKKNKVVYLHKYPETGQPYYVGIGNPERPYNFEKRSEFWRRTYEKYGIEVEVIHTGLTWEQACQIEIALIKVYGRRDIGTGCLVNMTDGGDGVNGYVASDELRKKRSEAITGEKHHFYGKKRPDISEKFKGRKRPNVSKKLRNGGNGKTKLSPAHVIKIKRLYDSYVERGEERGCVKKIAEEFGVSYTCIYDICKRSRCWSYLE